MIEITEESIKNQKVLIKTWKEIKKCSKKGLDTRRSLGSPVGFNKAMKYLCGTIVQLDIYYTVVESWTIAPWIVQEIIPICKEEGVELYDKQPIYAWDNYMTHTRALRFYNKQNNRVFRYDGARGCLSYANYEAIPTHMIPEWMIETQKTLED